MRNALAKQDPLRTVALEKIWGRGRTFMISRILLTGAACVALAACGGGGSGPPPSSGPSPTPTPTPTPSPTPTGSTARVLGLASGPSFWRFFDDSDFDDESEFVAGGYGNREGEYFPNFSERDGLPSKVSGQREGDLSDLGKAPLFIDAQSSLRTVLRAPGDATVVSPLTSLLPNGPDQDKLKRQLGVTENVFRLQTLDPDIRTFDPLKEALSDDAEVAADAERLLAANARALGLLSLQISPFVRSVFPEDINSLSASLDAAPDAFLFNDNAAMSALVARLPLYSDLQSEVQSAIAHLINAYAATVPLRIETPEQAAQFQMAVVGFLVPRISELEQTNSSEIAAEVLALNIEDIRDAIARFAELIPITETGFFFPSPDYYETGAGIGLTLVDDGIDEDHPIENDFTAVDDGFLIPDGIAVSQVAVPSSNVSEVSASLGENNLITIMPASGFTGLTYVDYTVTDGNGETQTARIFVRVK